MKSTKHVFLALAALVASGCVLDGNSDKGATAGSGKVFSMGSKWSADGGNAALDRISTTKAESIKSWANSDVVLSADAGVLYVLQRSKGVVTGYLGGDVTTSPTLDVNVGVDANPYAVTSLSGKLWVACYGSSFLKAIDLSSKALVDSIDLSMYSDLADAQTIPFMIAVHAWNGKLAVVLGRLNGWNPGDSTLVLVLDPATKNVKRIALPWKNAYGASWNGNQVLVACVGSWTDTTDGGLALVDLAAGTTRALLSGETAKRNIAMAAFGPAGKAIVCVANAKGVGPARLLDLASGTLGATIPGSDNVGALAWDGSQFWVGDHNDAAPVLLRVDASGDTLGRVNTTLASGSLAILQ